VSDRSLYETYLVEIVFRARSIEERCESLLTREFASENPPRLARALRKVAAYLAGAAQRIFAEIRWDDDLLRFADLRQLQGVDAVLRECSADLRYVHGAQSERLPWSTIPALESFFREFSPHDRFLVRPKWNYNYTIATEDLRQKYVDALIEFGESSEEALIDLDKPLFRIAFPAVERENIVLHALLAHELGHSFVSKVLTTERQAAFQDEALSAVATATQKALESENKTPEATGELFFEDVLKDRVAWNLNLAWFFYRRALEEFLADAVSIFLFGPAALFAMLEIAIQADLDELPEPRSGYPPWRARLRSALSILDLGGNVLFPLDAQVFSGPNASQRAERVNALLGSVRKLCAESTDYEQISLSSIAHIAYRHVHGCLEQDVRKLSDLPVFERAQKRLASSGFRKDVVALIQRLDHGLLPNAIETKIYDRKPAHLVEILNAASLFRASLETSLSGSGQLDHEPALALRRRADRLTLKAIEAAHLAREYWNEKKKGRLKERGRIDQPPVVNPGGPVDPQSASEVLSRSELVAALEHPTLSGRLIVSPLLEPDDSISAGSIDVRLGNQFLVFKKESFSRLDIGEPDAAGLERYQERHIKALREPFFLHPQQLVIGSTLEYIQLPPGLMAYVIGKSTWGRMGLIIATATKVDPGFRGCITLEIINEGEVPLVLYPGLPIAQLVIHRSGSDRYSGSYECATGPEFPNFRSKRTSWEYWTRSKR
jgi:dCTP deaminase